MRYVFVLFQRLTERVLYAPLAVALLLVLTAPAEANNRFAGAFAFQSGGVYAQPVVPAFGFAADPCMGGVAVNQFAFAAAPVYGVAVNRFAVGYGVGFNRFGGVGFGVGRFAFRGNRFGGFAFRGRFR
jgi:hypothetical protein